MQNFKISMGSQPQFTQKLIISNGSVKNRNLIKPEPVEPIKLNKLEEAKPSPLLNIISSDVGIKEAAADDAAMVIGLELQPILNNLYASSPDVNEFNFKYEGQDYRLINNLDENNNQLLELQNSKGTVLAKLENNSLEKLRSRLTLLNLFRQLNPNTQVRFHRLFDVHPFGQLDSKSPVDFGDGDGSTARMVLGAILTGIGHPDKYGLELLAYAMNKEADFLDNTDALPALYKGKLSEVKAGQVLKKMEAGKRAIGLDFPEDLFNEAINQKSALGKIGVLHEWIRPLLHAEFQTNKVIQQKMDELVGHLTYRQSHTRFRSLGDCAHDRFSNNKDADRKIREEIFAQLKEDEFFILGNHDLFLTKNFCEIDFFEITDLKEAVLYSFTYGCYAKDTATAEEWETHQNNVFINAYWDEEQRTIYSHHGVTEIYAGELPKIQTIFGRFHPSAMGNFPAFISVLNKQPRPRPDAMFEKGSVDARRNAHNFNELNDLKLGSELKPGQKSMQETAEKYDIRIVHGHSGEMKITNNVIGLNSRQKGLELDIVAVRLGNFKRPPSNSAHLDHFLSRQEKRPRLHRNVKATIL